MKSLPPTNYPHQGEMMFDYMIDYDEWFGPSSNDPSKLHLEPKFYRRRWLDNVSWFNQRYHRTQRVQRNRTFGR